MTVFPDRIKQTVTLLSDSTRVPAAVTVSFVVSVASIKTYQNETYGVFKTNYSDSIDGSSDKYIIATHTQLFWRRRIFPVVDELAHKVPISLTVQTKSLFKVVSNAALSGAEIFDLNVDSVLRFKLTPLILPAHFGFAPGDLEVLQNASARVTARVFDYQG